MVLGCQQNILGSKISSLLQNDPRTRFISFSVRAVPLGKSPQPGALRPPKLVVDYRRFNEQTKHDSYYFPVIYTILQKQANKCIFTVLDPKHGYHQMPLH